MKNKKRLLIYIAGAVIAAAVIVTVTLLVIRSASKKHNLGEIPPPGPEAPSESANALPPGALTAEPTEALSDQPTALPSDEATPAPTEEPGLSEINEIVENTGMVAAQDRMSYGLASNGRLSYIGSNEGQGFSFCQMFFDNFNFFRLPVFLTFTIDEFMQIFICPVITALFFFYIQF